jgi:hypothetical protein
LKIFRGAKKRQIDERRGREEFNILGKKRREKERDEGFEEKKFQIEGEDRSTDRGVE